MISLGNLAKSVILEGLKDEIEIVPATKEAVATFVKQHYLEKFPVAIQLIYMVNKIQGDQKLPIGMVIYGSPQPAATKFLEPEVSHNEITELKRLFIVDEVNMPNIESFVIGQTLKRIKQDKPEIKVVLTFADDNHGHKGTVYQATNAVYLGKSKTGLHKYIYILRGNLNAIKAKLQPVDYPKSQ